MFKFEILYDIITPGQVKQKIQIILWLAGTCHVTVTLQAYLQGPGVGSDIVSENLNRR